MGEETSWGREEGIAGVCGMINVSRREVGGVGVLSKVRNSLVGEMVLSLVTGDAAAAGIKLPLRFDRALGSIDLRRLCPPRGIREVSMA